MTRRNLLTGLMGLAAAVGWKSPSEVPPYKVMRITPEQPHFRPVVLKPRKLVAHFYCGCMTINEARKAVL